MAQPTTRNYYKILGITQKTNKADIKKKYRELAKKYHPDTNSGSKTAEDKFKIISEAYDVLSNAKKRKAYDRERSYRKKSPPRPRSQSDYTSGYEREPGGNRQGYEEPFAQEPEPVDPDMPTSGFDLQFMIDVPLPIVALGGTIPYTYEKYVQCEECEGTGTCGSDECPQCQGKQLVVRSVTLDVKIPPGVADQYTLSILKEGGAGRNGGPPGALYLKICTQPHPRFKRVKNDIIREVTISSKLAEEGGPLEVETLDGTTTIQVEEATLVGEELRVPGEGSAISWGKKRGNLIIKFNIEDD
ncbi:MAG: DnaJ domain-containing protein [Nitrospina sp.]|jgi:molecular chaperone DnaJ|nr:DnaJ domain-containing protein [Nitrospina sp.]MBT3367364.1 DnaJ domain-containing protein [Nitrospina sp.]MBT3415197.1 DnaJ domain-containing protein [Nitrospina sp.]MBT3857444.1 DnaJ domain-containing protein [Nitrospina sp.]MBT4104033.1 DnaJ domain-containing protein [Nitrospina sp.]